MLMKAGLLSLLLLVGPVLGAAPNENDDEGETKSRFRRTPFNPRLREFSSTLHTQADQEFGAHDDEELGDDQSDGRWFAAIDHAWERMLEIERRGERRRLSLFGDIFSRIQFPYEVCDTTFSKYGYLARETISNYFGGEDDLVPVYNQRDKTCYVLSSIPSIADVARQFLSVIPILPAMKTPNGLIDDIDSGDDTPSYLDVLLCPGYTFNATEEAVLSLAKEIIQSVNGTESLDGFSLTGTLTGTRDESLVSSEIFGRRLERVDPGSCLDFFVGLEIEAGDSGRDFFVKIPTEEDPDSDADIRDCLVYLIGGLAEKRQICWLDLRKEMFALNEEAQWVVQSGISNSRPFFDAGLTGEGQVIAVSDTGLDTDNCYFWDSTGDVVKNDDGPVDATRRKVIQYVAFADAGDEQSGHGTHVAGSVGGRRAVGGTSESTGLGDGMAYDAKLAFFDIGITGSPRLQVPRKASTLLDPGMDAGAKIHSASWGARENGYTDVERIYDEYMANHDDFLMIIAAGNDGDFDTPNTVGSPATCKNGLSVGATQNASPHLNNGMLGEDYLAYFSSRGPTKDGRMKPDILAPGFFIQSAEAQPFSEGECDTTDPDGLFFNAGTSMATPIVSGVAALVRQYFAEGRLPTAGGQEAILDPSSSLVKAVLINGGQPIVGVQRQLGGITSSEPYDIHQGFGRVNLIDSLPLEGSNSINAIVVDRQPIKSGEEDVYDLRIDSSGGCEAPLSATLVWTDPAGAPGCVSCVLNHIDLEVTTGQQRFFPNGRSGPDRRNNAKRVRIGSDNLVDGNFYQVRVEGANLESQPQKYALIVTGCFVRESDDGGSGPSPPTSSPAAAPPSSEPPEDCQDTQDEVVFVDANGIGRDCAYLAENFEIYQSYCSLGNVATTCRSTCGSCDIVGDCYDDARTESIEALDGDTRYYGNMFDVHAAPTSDLTIVSMDVHIRRAGIWGVAVFTKAGSNVGSAFREEDWTQVAVSLVFSEGYGTPATIPPMEFIPVSVQANSTQAFYVTMGSKDLVMTKGTEVGATAAENSDLRVSEGNAIVFPFGGRRDRVLEPYIWNGALHYLVKEGSGCLVVQDNGESPPASAPSPPASGAAWLWGHYLVSAPILIVSAMAASIMNHGLLM